MSNKDFIQKHGLIIQNEIFKGKFTKEELIFLKKFFNKLVESTQKVLDRIETTNKDKENEDI